jgi:hypothetical protein
VKNEQGDTLRSSYLYIARNLVTDSGLRTSKWQAGSPSTWLSVKVGLIRTEYVFLRHFAPGGVIGRPECRSTKA